MLLRRATVPFGKSSGPRLGIAGIWHKLESLNSTQVFPCFLSFIFCYAWELASVRIKFADKGAEIVMLRGSYTEIYNYFCIFRANLGCAYAWSCINNTMRGGGTDANKSVRGASGKGHCGYLH